MSFDCSEMVIITIDAPSVNSRSHKRTRRVPEIGHDEIKCRPKEIDFGLRQDYRPKTRGVF
jgi:hypothetical protein